MLLQAFQLKDCVKENIQYNRKPLTSDVNSVGRLNKNRDVSFRNETFSANTEATLLNSVTE